MAARRRIPGLLGPIAATLLLGCSSGTLDDPSERADGGWDATGADGAAPAADGASGDAAGSSDAAPPSLPSGFTADSTERCNGVDDDGDGAIDEDQTGWPGFCDRGALVPTGGYAFRLTAAEWRARFDAAWASARSDVRASLDRCDPCQQEPYYAQGPFKALLTMYRATGASSYLEDAVDLADRMIAASDPYDPSWASPLDGARYAAWVATQGELRYWDTSACAPSGTTGWRYQLNELQGLRGIAELARVLFDAGDARWQRFFAYADQVVSFYAMIGDSEPRLDSAGDKRDHYVICALDLYHVSGEARFLDWARATHASLRAAAHLADGPDFVRIMVGVSPPYSDEILDVSHANRDAELFRVQHEERPALDGSADVIRRAVNTLLFRIWEDDPTVELSGVRPYPDLYRSFVDGSNRCSSGSPPYRLGSVSMGWHELARYDRRVLHLVESLALAVSDGSLITPLPAADGCPSNGNTNYSYELVLLAEMVYLQR